MQLRTLVFIVLLMAACTGSEAGENSREYTFADWQGPAITVRLFEPANVTPSTTIVIVVHGWSRDAPRYFDDWRNEARERGFILAVPHFPVADFPGSHEFNLGHVFDKQTKKRRPKAQWTFSAIEALFDDVVAKVDGRQRHYTLYGHSAGGQFVHRFLYYMPDARARRLISANAGWYTLPDFATSYPYGLKGSGIAQDDVTKAFGRDVVLLLGREDIQRNDPNLRKSPEAERQGPNRFVRGQTMYATAEKTAGQLDRRLEWKVVVVEDAGHNNAAMTPAAAALVELFGSTELPPG